MTLSDLEKWGYRILRPGVEMIGNYRVRPNGATPKIGDDVIELTDIDIGQKHGCPECPGEKCLVANGLGRTREFNAVLDGKKKRLVIYQHNWKCRLCGSYRKYDFRNVFEKENLQEQNNVIIQEAISHPEKSFHYYAKKHGISVSQVKKLVEKYFDDHRDRIYSVCECDKIVLYPFEYEGTVRCFVYGQKVCTGADKLLHEKDNCNTVLLYILPQYDIETITTFLHSKASYFATKEVVFCDFNPTVYAGLYNLCVDSDVSVIQKILLDALDNANPLSPEEKDYGRLLSAISGIAEIVEETGILPVKVAIKLGEYWSKLDMDVKRQLEMLWNRMEPCLDGCNNYHSFRYDLVKRVEVLINTFKKKHVGFRNMADMVMFNGKAMCDAGHSDATLKAMFVLSRDVDLYGYYVDISLLLDVFREFINESTDHVSSPCSIDEFASLSQEDLIRRVQRNAGKRSQSE